MDWVGSMFLSSFFENMIMNVVKTFQTKTLYIQDIFTLDGLLSTTLMFKLVDSLVDNIIENNYLSKEWALYLKQTLRQGDLVYVIARFTIDMIRDVYTMYNLKRINHLNFTLTEIREELGEVYQTKTVSEYKIPQLSTCVGVFLQANKTKSELDNTFMNQWLMGKDLLTKEGIANTFKEYEKEYGKLNRDELQKYLFNGRNLELESFKDFLKDRETNKQKW
jgi:hypothetical protein